VGQEAKKAKEEIRRRAKEIERGATRARNLRWFETRVFWILIAVALVSPTLGAASGAPESHHGSILYTGRGKGVKRVSFRLEGHRLVEASIVVIESCTTRGDGHVRRSRWRQELEEASPREPLRVNGRGRFRIFRSEVELSNDEIEEFVGTVTPRSIAGGIALRSSEHASESGVFENCHTGPFGGPMQELTFHAWRR
jgi:hypothetical protein